MCGILGIVTPKGTQANTSRETFARVRDAMEHRGPDSSGVWQHENVLLGHRRLAVIELSAAGQQPMLLHDAGDDGAVRSAMVYNGELYNDAELRGTLEASGTCCASASDTETLARCVQVMGTGVIETLRGMFAFANWHVHERTLVLGRDPMGIKPVYYATVRSGGVEHFCFASELQAMEKLLIALGQRCEPDMVTVSAYMTTIRATLGARTLLQGVRVVLPGEVIEVDAGGDVLRVTHQISHHVSGRAARRSEELAKELGSYENAVARVRETVIESVRAHLVSDVPVCTLLSGGLDSAIVASIARTELSFCAGARDSGDGAQVSPDFAFAAEAAAAYGMRHQEAIVTREMFAEQWAAMVKHNRQPLSTPNEIAIHHVAKTLRAAGCVVTLSGEGADELFGGYDLALTQARDAWASGRVRTAEDAGEFELDANAWIARVMKQQVLTAGAWRAAEQDDALRGHYREAFAKVAAERDDDEPLQAHLRWQRATNLVGLLQRLDTATMRAGVEGRTPFADVRVMELAESLPLGWKLRSGDAGLTTKAVLRDAFASDVPAGILRRPKASFPLPFQAWVGDSVSVLKRSEFIREIVSPAVVQQVMEHPRELWHVAWPLVNLAMWRG